jgi:hypothetical protein
MAVNLSQGKCADMITCRCHANAKNKKNKNIFRSAKLSHDLQLSTDLSPSTFFLGNIMAAVKAKSATAAAAAKGKGAKSPPSTNGTSTLVSVTNLDTSETTLTGGSGKPDKAAYDAEQEKTKSEIDALQVKLVSACFLSSKLPNTHTGVT